MSRDVMLTTVDKPFDPFEDFDLWLSYDIEKGYDTCGLVARLTQTSSEFSEDRQMADIESAIDEFLAVDPIQHYKKVVKS